MPTAAKLPAFAPSQHVAHEPPQYTSRKRVADDVLPSTSKKFKANRSAVSSKLAAVGPLLSPVPLCPEAAVSQPVPTLRERNLARLRRVMANPSRVEAWRDRSRSIARRVVTQAVNLGLFWGTQRGMQTLGADPSSYATQVSSLTFGSLVAVELGQFGTMVANQVVPLNTDGAHSNLAYHQLHREDLADARIDASTRAALARFDKIWINSRDIAYCSPQKLALALQVREGIIKSLPQAVYDISHQSQGGNPGEKTRLDKAIKALVDRYPPSMRNNLRTFVARMRSNCFVTKPDLAAIYLYGKPGTGKTYFARSLAKALGQPLVEISLKDASRQMLFGSDYVTFSPTSSSSRDEAETEASLVGRLLHAVVECGVLNPIVYIDEGGDSLAEQSVISLLKRVLDPDQQRWTIANAGGIEVDLSRVTWLISGNSRLSDAALRSRLKEVEFETLDVDAKRLVIHNELTESLLNHNDLKPALRSRIGKHVWLCAERILAEDVSQKNPGVRVDQEVIRDLVSFVRDTVLSNETCKQSELNELIRDGFARRLPEAGLA